MEQQLVTKVVSIKNSNKSLRKICCLKWLLAFLCSIGTIAAQGAPFPGNLPTAIPTIDPARVSQRLTPPLPQDLQRQAPLIRKTKQAPPAQPASETIKFVLNNISISGSTIYSNKDLAVYYQPYIGKLISLSNLQQIVDNITARYRKDGYVISRAILPAQRIKNGVVEIRIIEGYVSEVYVDGNTKGLKSQLDPSIKQIKQMRPLQIKKLERYVLLLNDLAGVTVKTVLSPSPTIPGATELTFIVEQTRIAANAEYNNRGTRYMGPQDVLATVEIDNPTYGADKLLLQTVDTPSTDEMRFYQLNYTRPLGGDGLKMVLNGNFTETNPGFILEKLDLIGRSKDWSAELNYPLLRSRTSNLSTYGKFEWLDSYTDIFGTTLFNDNIRSLRVGLSYDKLDKARGINVADVEFSKGLDVFGSSPKNPRTPLSRVHGCSDYNKITADISRLQAIGSRYSLLAAVTGQYSFNDALLSAEEFGFGGTKFGRGYDPSEITGDSGAAGKMEFRVNTFPALRLLQTIQYYAFYDAGVVWNTGSSRAQPRRESGTSAGGGARVNLNRYFSGSLEAAKPLTRKVDTQVAAGHDGNDWRFFFGLNAMM